MAVGGELHSDEEALLLEQGSDQRHLWGINIYPALPQLERVEFDSLINVRPSQGNRSRGVDDEAAWRRYFGAYGMAAALQREAARAG
jgi:hypothetical protein